MKRKALKAAFPYTLPICVGFLFLGISYGFLMRSKGFSFVYPLCTSLFIFAGSMEFVTAELLLSAYNPLHAFLLALMVNARHLFYGLSMLQKYRGTGMKKFYLKLKLWKMNLVLADACCCVSPGQSRWSVSWLKAKIVNMCIAWLKEFPM